MIQRIQVIVFEETINWFHFGLLILFGALSYAVVCYLIRRRDVVVEGVERDYPPPNPDAAAFGAVIITDALIRFVTLRFTTFFFSTLFGGAIPLEMALLVEVSALGIFLLCSFVVVMLISKALLPTSFGRAALISVIKVVLQFVLIFLFALLLILYNFLTSGS